MMEKWLAVVVSLSIVSATRAEVFYDAGPGWGAPSGILGGYTMTPFPLDERLLFEDVLNVPDPFGDEIEFMREGGPFPMNHRRVGQGWATWSHGYWGDVYYTRGYTSVSLVLPPATAAFEFYVEPNPFSIQVFTAVSDDGTSSGEFQLTGSAEARYVGFYGTDGSTIASIEVNCSSDFAIGEFAIARVPEPGALLLLLAGGAVLFRRG